MRGGRSGRMAGMADILRVIAWPLSFFWGSLIVFLIRDWLRHKPEAESPDNELPADHETPTLDEDVQASTWRDPKFWTIGVPSVLKACIFAILFWPVLVVVALESWWPRKPK